MTPTREIIFKPYLHCQQCGQADEGDEYTQGYSHCCNEIVMWPTTKEHPCDNSCYHDDLDEYPNDTRNRW